MNNKLILGAILAISGAGFIFLGQESHFGYMKEHYVLAPIVGLLWVGSGAWLWARHLQDIQTDLKRKGL